MKKETKLARMFLRQHPEWMTDEYACVKWMDGQVLHIQIEERAHSYRLIARYILQESDDGVMVGECLYRDSFRYLSTRKTDKNTQNATK